MPNFDSRACLNKDAPNVTIHKHYHIFINTKVALIASIISKRQDPMTPTKFLNSTKIKKGKTIEVESQCSRRSINNENCIQ